MLRRLIALLFLPLALAGAAWAGASQESPSTVGITTFVIKGRGWGHALGMGQWGALGMAKKGFAYDRILTYYYRGTSVGPAPVQKVRVLLSEAGKVTVSSAADFSVQDAAGTIEQLPAGAYSVGAGFKLRIDPALPPVALQQPLTFLPGKAALALGKTRYRGQIQLQLVGTRLQAVNVVGLDAYVRGVVTREMPKDWPEAALEAQAVAARSYALAVRQLGGLLYPDTRSQVYGGLDAETPGGVAAVKDTKGQVVLYGGKVATTYYFSSSGGRTASYADLYPGRPAVPYLVSVADPYDVVSPYHTWGPYVFTAAELSKKLHVTGITDLVPDRPSGRPRQILALGARGQVTLPAGTVRAALGLRSSWISIGVLSLARPTGRLTAGSPIALTGVVKRVKDPVTLEQKPAGGAWEAGPALTPAADGTFSLQVAPTVTTQYRLIAGKVRTKPLRVPVAAARS
jgi:stage II sporulation protein D